MDPNLINEYFVIAAKQAEAEEQSLLQATIITNHAFYRRYLDDSLETDDDSYGTMLVNALK